MKTRTKRFLKLTIGAELKKQLVTSVKLKRVQCNDKRDFKPVVRKARRIKPIRIGIWDKGCDVENNHKLLRDEPDAISITPARYQDVPLWRTHGIYRSEMKRGYSKKRYHQMSKDETIFSVVKRTMEDEVRSMRTRFQNKEMRFIREHPVLRVTKLSKRASKPNPTEWIVNRPLKSVVCSNGPYKNMDEVDSNTARFLRQHRTNLRT